MPDIAILRRKQSTRAMRVIGPLLDAFEALPNDVKDMIEEDAPELFEHIHELNEAMEAE